MTLEITTKRHVLRSWRESYLEPFAKLNANPKVMEYFPSVMTKEESGQMVKKMQAKIDETGYGFLAVSLIDTAEFIGFIGLNTIDKSSWPVHFSPAIEIGWRLAAPYWKKGYATEGALACLTLGFETLNLPEIVSFTAKQNTPSRAVMERIGMHHDLDGDFDHPKLPDGHRLKKCVLYRLSLTEWEKNNDS